MATIMNLSSKGFDYLCALSDVSEMIEQQRERGVSTDDTLDILIQLGNAAQRQFDDMLEDLRKRDDDASDEKKAGSPRDSIEPGDRGGCDTGVI